MKVFIAGTPLESMVWKSAIDKVAFKWRDNDAFAQHLVFLTVLINSAREERARLIEENFK